MAEKAIQLYDEDVDAYHCKRSILMRLGRTEEAKIIALKAKQVEEEMNKRPVSEQLDMMGI